MNCGYSKYLSREKIVIMDTITIRKVWLHTEYSGTISMYMNDNNLETYNGNIHIKVIDINEHGLDPDCTYSLSYLRLLKAKKIDLEKSCFENDILYHAFEFIEFLKAYNIKFMYNELYILSGVKELDNAYWNGSYLTFGNGIYNYSNPLTSPAIVGHELTHAVIQSICNLEYINESGSLNESYADIVGVMFEFHLKEKNNIGFELGTECYFDGHSMRSFKDPNSCNQPKSIRDPLYYRGSQDNGGVHINSGIINHLFYKLQLENDKKNILNIFIKVLYKMKHNSTFNDFKRLLLKYIQNRVIDEIL